MLAREMLCPQNFKDPGFIREKSGIFSGKKGIFCTRLILLTYYRSDFQSRKDDVRNRNLEELTTLKVTKTGSFEKKLFYETVQSPTFLVWNLMTPPPPPPRYRKCENSGKFGKNQGTSGVPLQPFLGPLKQI